jgi:nucleotide-binding universal stress UspA family protein
MGTYALDAGSGMHHNRAALKILLQKRLSDLFPDDPTGVPIERSVLEGQAAAVILQQSKAQQTDLLIMGSHPYGRLHKFFTVSTLDEVMSKTPCPVLAVPTRHPGPITTSGNGSGIAG